MGIDHTTFPFGVSLWTPFAGARTAIKSPRDCINSLVTMAHVRPVGRSPQVLVVSAP
jgi:hypothetical protein